MRPLILLVFLVCLLSTTSVFAGNRKVVLMETMPVPIVTSHTDAIIAAFKERGYYNGGNIDFEVLQAGGSKDHAIKLLKESISQKRPDLVITVATLASQAAAEVLSDSDIPIIFCSVTDPVGAGMVDDLYSPGGKNISGVVFTQRQETKIDMVMRLIGSSRRQDAVRVGIVCTDYPSSVSDLQALLKVASFADEIEFEVYQFPYEGVPKGLPSMHKNFIAGVETLKTRVDFWWQPSDPLSELDSFTQVLFDSGIPIIHGHTASAVEQGALMTVLYSVKNAGELVADMADKVFEGSEVGSFKVVIPKNFNLYLNAKTAKKLELSIPSHLLMIAGENVYR